MSVRDRTVIGVLALVVALAAAWFLLIQPKRQQLSDLKKQVSSEQSQLASAQSELASGEAARTQFRSSYASMVRRGEAVPTDDNVGSLIYQVQSAATGAGVDFRALSLASGGSSGSSGASSSSSQNQLPPGVTAGPAGFPIEPFTFTFRGSFFRLADFFERLQQFVTPTQRGVVVHGRLLTLNSINLAPDTGGFPQITATVSATAFLLPSSQGLLAGATPVGPGPLASGQALPGVTPGSQQSPTSPAAPSSPAGSGGSAAPPTAVVAGGQP